MAKGKFIFRLFVSTIIFNLIIDIASIAFLNHVNEQVKLDQKQKINLIKISFISLKHQNRKNYNSKQTKTARQTKEGWRRGKANLSLISGYLLIKYFLNSLCLDVLITELIAFYENYFSHPQRGGYPVCVSHTLFLMRKLTLKIFCRCLLIINIGQPLK